MSTAQSPRRPAFDQDPWCLEDGSDETERDPLAGATSLTGVHVPWGHAADVAAQAAPEGLDRMLNALAECAVLVIVEEIAPLLGIMIEEVRAAAKIEPDWAATTERAQAIRDIRLEIEISSVWGERAIDAISRAWSEQEPIILDVTQPTRLTVSFAMLT